MEDRLKILSEYRFKSALEALTDAGIMYDNGRYRNALDGFDSSNVLQVKPI